MSAALLQGEASECGLACLAMVSRLHGRIVELDELRATLGTSSRGVTLDTLMSQAARLGLITRPLRLELDELPALSMPCVLHWDLNHFVVLHRMRRGRAEILDPAVGLRRLRLQELSEHFSGIALELEPGDDFVKLPPAPRVRFIELAGRVVGLRSSLGKIAVVALALELFALAAPLYGQVVVDDAVLAGDRSLLIVLALGFGILLAIQTAIGFARSWMVLALGQSLRDLPVKTFWRIGMRTLTITESRAVSGGECGATGMCGSDGVGYGGGNASNDAAACANAMNAWGGLAGSIAGSIAAAIGGLFGGFMGGAAGLVGFGAGSIGGAAAAAAFSDACNGNNSY